MKTSEFIRRLGSRYRAVSVDYGHLIKIVDSFCDEMAIISCLKSSDISLFTEDIGLAKLCIEYAETPIEEREDEKKYTVVLPDPEYIGTLRIALCRMFDKHVVLTLTHEAAVIDNENMHLTEAEIKRNHEYLWQFAKEIKE